MPNIFSSWIVFGLYISFVVSLIVFITSMFWNSHLKWKHKYDALTSQVTVKIPKTGRYDIRIRYRIPFLAFHKESIKSEFSRKHTPSAFIAPRLNFSMQQKNEPDRTIQYTPFQLRLGRSARASTGNSLAPNVVIGYFDAPSPGEYVITTLPDSTFPQKTRVIIEKHMPRRKHLLHMFIIWISAGVLLISTMYLFFNHLMEHPLY